MPNPPLNTNYVDRRPARGGELPAKEYNRNAMLTNEAWDAAVGGARLFVQQEDPATTDPNFLGPAIWYVTDGAGNITDVRIRA